MKLSSPQNNYISNIANKLAEDVTKQILPHSCIFEPTGGGKLFHYRVKRAGLLHKKSDQQKVIAWAWPYKIGRKADIPRRPCLLVSIPCNLLGIAPVASKLTRTTGGSWGNPTRPECQGVTYALCDNGYKILSDALTTAAKNWI